jgi:hypothetical protein
MRGGGMGGPGGGMGGPGGGMEMPKIMVRWDSAGPMRAAASKLEAPELKSIEEWSKEFYIVTVSGMSMMRQRQEGRTPDPERMKQMSERVRSNTTLKRKGKDDLQPSRVEMVKGADGMVMAFLFPRTEAISADDKDVSFETAMGPMQIKSKFVLKEMMVQGKLEL